MKNILHSFTQSSPFRFAALVSAALVAGRAAAAVPLNGSMSVGVETSVVSFGNGFQIGSNSGSDSAGWVTVPATLGVSASAPASIPGGSSANAFANGSATWAADGNSGSGKLTYGWSFVDGGDYADPGMQTNENGPNWSYTFTADATGDFVMNYDLTSSGDPQGIAKGFFIGSDGGSTLNLNSTGSGTYTQAVTAGTTYTVLLANNGNSFDRDGGLDVSITANFDWTLPGATSTPSVPDAGATALLLALGLVGLGIARRAQLA